AAVPAGCHPARAAIRRPPCHPTRTDVPTRRRGAATRCPAATARAAATARLAASPSRPAEQVRGRTRVMPHAPAAWDPADPAGRAALCRRAILPPRHRARGTPGTAAPDGTRPVRDTQPQDTQLPVTEPPDTPHPDTGPLAAAGRCRRATRTLPATAARPTTACPSTAATPRSSGRRIILSARRTGPGRRAS